MTSKAKMTAGKIISLAVVLLLIIASVGFAAYFSNGFTSEFKTFYVECNGEKILNDKDYYEMSANEEYRFDVKYLFDVGSKENKLGYHVKILPHTTKETNFDFTADGKTYNYGAEGELTLTKSFKELKGKRQLILSTHNANLPVGGDAENIVVLDYNGKNCYLKYNGSLEQKTICRQVLSIMEGGQEALQERNKNYEMIVF